MEEFSQAGVVEFLSDPKTHGGAPVERMSTHGAHIFLAGDRAYKLKRAIKLPFFDFSTVTKRRAMLENELRINKPTAPAIYLEVRSICVGLDGALNFGGRGPVLDWVLVMTRFDQSCLLDQIAMRGALDDSIVDHLAESIAGMHHLAPVVKQPMSASFTAMALANIVGLTGIADASRATALETRFLRTCAALAEHMDGRGRNGFVRRCHGDLHLRNIVLLDGEPTPFDALEFDPALATSDVYYDLAFLIMDMEHRALRSSADRLLNRYVAITNDFEGLHAFPLYLSVRAAIRAKVTLIAANTAQDIAVRHTTLKEADAYLDLANGYLPPPRPRLIGIGGLSGTGKSTVARALAPHIGPGPGALVFRSDVFRKTLNQVEESTRLPAAAYTPQASLQVYEALMAAAQQTLAAGYSAIVDAVFSHHCERAALEALANDQGVQFVGLWLDAALDVRMKRIGGRVNDASDADLAVAEAQERLPLAVMTWSIIDASGGATEVQERALTVAMQLSHSWRVYI